MFFFIKLNGVPSRDFLSCKISNQIELCCRSIFGFIHITQYNIQEMTLFLFMCTLFEFIFAIQVGLMGYSVIG